MVPRRSTNSSALIRVPDLPVRLFVITGLSGSGKSTAARCFEDLGHHCIDNLPLPLLRHLVQAPALAAPCLNPIVLVTDLRTPGLASELPRLLDDADPALVEPVLLFLDSSDDVLVRRYSETRRRHPLTEDGERLIDGIRRERRMLEDMRGRAARVIDTTDSTIHELRATVYEEFGSSSAGGLTVNIVSFGFKFGVPAGVDLVFDVRFLPNPYFVSELRERPGTDRRVQRFLRDHPGFDELVERLEDLLAYLLPKFRDENRSYLTVGVGCTGGRHRSVAVSEAVADRLVAGAWQIRLQHRDIGRQRQAGSDT